MSSETTWAQPGELIPSWFVAVSAAVFVTIATVLALRGTTPDGTL